MNVNAAALQQIQAVAGGRDFLVIEFIWCACTPMHTAYGSSAGMQRAVAVILGQSRAKKSTNVDQVSPCSRVEHGISYKSGDTEAQGWPGMLRNPRWRRQRQVSSLEAAYPMQAMRGGTLSDCQHC